MREAGCNYFEYPLFATVQLATMRYLVLLWLSLPTMLSGAVPGAWEDFATQANGEAWFVYDFAVDDYFYPEYEEGGGNPYIWSDSNTDEGLWILADSSVAQGALTNDYTGIAGLVMWVLIDDPALMRTIDIAILSESTPEPTYYYSMDYPADWFPEPGFYDLAPLFSDPWFTYDETSGSFVSAVIDETVLTNITEIGARFFPAIDNTDYYFAGLDEVLLVPVIQRPKASASTAEGFFTITMDPEPGHQYQLETGTDGSWEPVPGEDGITGPDPYEFGEPTAGSKFFRFTTSPFYTPVVTKP